MKKKFPKKLILVFEVIVQPHGNIYWHFQVRPKSWKSDIVQYVHQFTVNKLSSFEYNIVIVSLLDHPHAFFNVFLSTFSCTSAKLSEMFSGFLGYGFRLSKLKTNHFFILLKTLGKTNFDKLPLFEPILFTMNIKSKECT